MKTQRKNSARQSRKAKSLPHNTIVGICAVCVIAAAVFGGMTIHRHDSAVRARAEKTIADCAAAQSAISSGIAETLSRKLAVTRVYNKSDTLLFQLCIGGGLPNKDLPKVFLSGVLNAALDGESLRSASYSEFVNSQTWIGSLGGDASIAEQSKGSLGWATVQLYCERNLTMLSDEFKLVISEHLDSTYSSEELLSYIVATGDFGGYDGAAAAAMSWFNKSLDDLNTAQLSYLVYSYDNDNPSFDDFAKKYPDVVDGAKTAEEFGFMNVGADPYWLVREKLVEELEVLLGDAMYSEDYYVKLGLDSNLQTKLQEAIDTGLKSSIALDANGQSSVDGTVGVVDPNTGLITALVGGRSINNVSRELVLDCTSLIGNIEAAAEEMKKDATLTYASLKPVETAAGITEYFPFGYLVLYDQLGSIGISPTVQATSTLTELLEFGASLYTSNVPRLISEVQTSDGTVVYKVTAKTLTPDSDVLALINNSYEGTTVSYTMDCTVGSVYGTFSSEYIVGVLCGTGTAGYSLTSDDANACAATAQGVLKLLEEYYPRTPQPIDPSGDVKAKVETAYDSNTLIVQEIVSTWVLDLETREIVSVETQQAFEADYQTYEAQLHSYEGLISEELFVVLHEDLSAVRASRADELLKYVA